ncbi:hypothetical protein PYH37_004591 [Sinorhizobium numidicum]|uniref:Uncharacterized protein n=1 Tax=Sinorhizobium numidicum TaxID=680248 RepID=A0ABY8CWD0_9HYPH|nr:hypothetical protein [Sinorhizobium numidicum]WEX76295.1 hypothetical protein PYH37_004591 [Sinorhizobium numidicum]WEX82955.1 hypothetical protein PYH38_005303 [Sinorhizobium numidicum]
MVGKKTHEQQQRVLQRRENTSNAGKDFDAEADLQRSDALRKAYRKGQKLDVERGDAENSDERGATQGTNQESRHHKGSGS